MNGELETLNQISTQIGQSVGVNAQMVKYTFQLLNRHLRGLKVLELGPAEGVMTELLVQRGCDVTVVEGAKSFCESLERRFPSIQVHNDLFEEFSTSETYDMIVLGHVLEHVQNPTDILKRCRGWLKPKDGRIFAAVPNCRSLHRQAAVMMHLLPRENALNPSDLEHGHRRVFSPEEFRACFFDANLHIETFGGYWLKPISNRQIEEAWTPTMLDTFMQLGERYPDIAAEIYVVAR